MRKQGWIILLVLTLLPLPAGAAFSDAWEALAARPDGFTLTIDGAELGFLNASDEALSLAKDLIAPLSLSLSMDPDDPHEGIISFSDGLKSVSCWEPDLMDEYVPILSSVQIARQLFETTLPALFDTLSRDEPPETEDKGTNFQVLGYSPARKSLYVSPEQFDRVASPYNKTALNRLFFDFPAGEAIERYLADLMPQGELTFRRNLNADGSDMAFQFGGQISTSGGEDSRKLTFVIGQSAKTFYLSIKAPAVKGSNDFRFVMTCPVPKETKKKNTFDVTLDIRRSVDGESWTRKDTVSAVNRKDKGEAVTVTVQRQEKAGGITQEWKLTLTAEGDGEGGLSGKAAYSHKHAASKVLEGTVRFALVPGKKTAAGDDLLSPEEFDRALLDILIQKAAALSPKERQLLHHMLRTDEWMNGPSVQPLPETEDTEV